MNNRMGPFSCLLYLAGMLPRCSTHSPSIVEPLPAPAGLVVAAGNTVPYGDLGVAVQYAPLMSVQSHVEGARSTVIVFSLPLIQLCCTLLSCCLCFFSI